MRSAETRIDLPIYRFEEFYERMKEEGKTLLSRMQALETYPPYHDAPLLGDSAKDYQHAVEYMQISTGHRKIGTLSQPEWDATCECKLLRSLLHPNDDCYVDYYNNWSSIRLFIAL